MRVSDNTNFDTVRETIRRSKERMETLQKQASTLKKVNTPSDDPVGAGKLLEIRTDKVNNEQFQSNAKLAQSYLENTEHAIAELADIVVRAKEIALQQSSGPSSNDDTRVAIAEEITQLYQQSVSAANRRIGDRYIFGGYKTDKPPVTPEGKYVGDDGQMMVEVGRDVFISMNVPGGEAFALKPKTRVLPELGAAPSRKLASEDPSQTAPATNAQPQVANVFDELQALRIGLLTGDNETIRNTLERFDQIHTQLNSMRAKVGSRINGLEGMSQSLERQSITNAQLGTSIEDADMAQVVSDLAKEESVYRTALQTSTKLIQPGLMEFLK